MISTNSKTTFQCKNEGKISCRKKRNPYLIVGARFEILTHLHTKQLSAEWRDKAKLNQVVAAANHRSFGAKPRWSALGDVRKQRQGEVLFFSMIPSRTCSSPLVTQSNRLFAFTVTLTPPGGTKARLPRALAFYAVRLGPEEAGVTSLNLPFISRRNRFLNARGNENKT